ncbi:Cation/H+ exchanger [Mycena rebaudengoi]|nr:Cation/H+ exchanger [Mycena rebaudengoi]
MSSPEYITPELPLLLTVSSFLYLINVAEALFTRYINAGLLGSLCIGILYGSQVADILPAAVQTTFITLGYVGLLLIIFEAGLSTTMSLLFDNLLLSCMVAISGISLPIALSMLLLHFGYGYSPIQSFAAGAALSTTSLGTTLAVLKPEYRQTRTGTVLMAAALLDDIGGLVMASILSQLSAYEATSSIPWYVVGRPILVSFGFACGVPLLAFVSRYAMHKCRLDRSLTPPRPQLFILVATLSGFVAGAKYAGTSELFGAYLAGAFMTFVFGPSSSLRVVPEPESSPPVLAFHHYILPFLQVFLSPMFFASIGTALPIRSLGSVGGSPRVIWRGLVYSLLMGIAKAVVGVWMLIWPDLTAGKRWFGRQLVRPAPPENNDDDKQGADGEQIIIAQPTSTVADEPFTPIVSAALVGFAMIARGEIALIIAEIAKPLLGDGASEPFAVVIWATMLNTAGGAILVGFLLRARRA